MLYRNATKIVERIYGSKKVQWIIGQKIEFLDFGNKGTIQGPK